MTVSIGPGWTIGAGVMLGGPPPPVDLYTTLAGSGGYSGFSYLSIDPGVTPAAGAFTIEGWFNNNSNTLVGKALWGTDQSVGMSLFTADDATITLDRYGGGYQPSYTWPASTIQLNKWQYIVLNRNATTDLETMWIGTFVNNYSTVTCARATGASGGGSPSGGTQTDSQNWGNINWLGRYYNGYFSGYITNFRVTIGAAMYDSNSATITAPVAPLTSDANTQYLMLGPPVTTDSSGYNQTVTNNGVLNLPGYKPF